METTTKNREVTINLIAGDKRIDDFLHRCGVFESFRRLGTGMSCDYEMIVSEPDMDYLMRFKDSLEKKGGVVVTAVWFADNPEIHYVDWTVKITSNGQKWMLLGEYLSQFGIKQPEKLHKEEIAVA